MKYFIIGVFAVVLLGFTQVASAAVLYLEPENVTLGPGDTATIDVKIDLTSGCINTVDGYLKFPNDRLAVVSFLTGESIIPIWVERPSDGKLQQANDVGELHFSGGIPGGYCGKIPGDPGPSNTVAQLVVQVPSLMVSDSAATEASLALDGRSRVFLNDGLGTVDGLVTRGTIVYLSPRQTQPNEDWRAVISADQTPPEPFVIELYRDPKFFNNRYYIVFDTTDKQTGIDHFEVLELRAGETIGVAPVGDWLDKLLKRERPAAAWQTAVMPYPLTDQKLLSTIRAKAVDKAGNERVVEYTPSAAEMAQVSQAAPDKLRLVIIISVSLIALTLVVLLLILIIKRIIKRYSHADEQNTPPDVPAA